MQLGDILATPTTPNPGPLQRPGVSKLIDLLGASPGLPPEFVQSILSGIGAGIQGRRDERREQNQGALQSFYDTALPYATSGYATPEGLAALQSSASALDPTLSRPRVAGRLEDITTGLTGLAGQVPGQMPESEPLSPEAISAIDQDIRVWATGGEVQPNGQPYGLHEAMLRVIQPLRAQGASDEVIAQVQNFIEQRWAMYGGPQRPATSIEAPTSGLASLQRPSVPVPNYSDRYYEPYDPYSARR